MTLQRKSKHTSLVALNKNLSIQFSLDGFSFCISNSDTQEHIHLSEYSFDIKLETPKQLLSKIESIFRSESLVQQDFKEVKVIHQNNLNTLVPNTYFKEDKLKTYLDFNIKTLATDFIAFDDLQNLEAKNIYVPYVNINNYFFQNFGEFEYQHHASVLIDKLIAQNTSEEKRMFVNVSENNLDVIVLENKKLLLYNNFTFNTREDFIYYILFVAEQLHLDTEKVQLTFLGAIEKDSEIYKITYNYVRNIDFTKPKTNFLSNTNDFSPHSNYILVG